MMAIAICQVKLTNSRYFRVVLWAEPDVAW